MLEPTPVKVTLSNIHCYDEGDSIGSAEPYLWTVFFKIDGDTAHVNTGMFLEGTATVVATPGNHGDLGPGGVDGGEDVPIPPELGEFSTILTPIPVDGNTTTNLPGVVGCVVILLEQDSTPDHAVATGHQTLNDAVQQALNDLIPTLHLGHTSPSDDDIKKLTDKIGKQVEDAISDQVSIWDWLKVLGNMDDKIGSAVFYKSQSDILSALMDGIAIEQEWENEGDWKIMGRIGAVIDALQISWVHKPSGNAEAHHIEFVGGVVKGQPWQLPTKDVIRWIEAGTPFHVLGNDGSHSEVGVYKHWVSTANPTGLYIATNRDGSKADNLLSLPDQM